MEYDLTGNTLMPGFINTHVHLMDCFDGFNNDKLRKWLMSGITYLRDEGIVSRHTATDAYTQSLNLLPLKTLEAICDQSHKHGKKYPHM